MRIEQNAILIRQTESRQESGIDQLAKKGTFSAVVSGSKDGKYLLTAENGFEFAAEKEKLHGDVAVGDSLEFELTKKDGAYNIKQVSQGFKQEIKQARIKNSNTLLMEGGLSSAKGNMFADKAQQERQAEEERRVNSAMTKIRRDILYASDNARSGVVSELLSAGISVGSLDMGTLNTVNAALNQKYAAQPESVRDELGEVRKQELSGLPELGDDDVVRLMKSGDEASIDNILKAQSGESGKLPKPDRELLDKLRPQILKALEQFGIEPDALAIDCAEKLISYELPVSEKNLRDFINLNKLGELKPEDIEAFAALKVKEGENFGDIVPDAEAIKQQAAAAVEIPKTREIVQTLPKMDAGYINFLLKNGIGLNLGNMTAAVRAGNRTDLSKAMPEAFVQELQVREIAARLTPEVLGDMTKRAVQLASLPFEAVTAEISISETRSYSAYLTNAGVQDTAAGAEMMSQSYAALRSTTVSISISISMTYTAQSAELKPLIDGIREKPLAEIAQNAKRISLTYEQNLTAINVKYGDSFDKAGDQFAGFLEQRGFAATKMNIRAAKAMSRAGMEITEQNLYDVKTALGKLDRVNNELHPVIAAEIIAGGENPLEMTVDELIRRIEQFQEKHGGDLAGTAAEGIADLDRKNALEPGEREQLVGVFRMLHQIGKNGMASVGAVMNAEKELNFGNLLEASRLFRGSRGHYDQLEGTQTEEVTAVSRYNEQSVDEFTRQARPKSVLNLLRDEDTRGLMLDEAAALMREFNKNDADTIEDSARRLETLKEAAPNLVKAMVKSGMTVTPANVELMRKLSKGANVPDELAHLERDFEWSAEQAERLGSLAYELSPDGFADALNGSAAGRGDRLDGLIFDRLIEDDFSAEALTGLKALYEGTAGSNGDTMEFPVKFMGGYANLKLLTTGEVKAGDAKMLMSLETRAMGEIGAYIRVKDDSCELNITCQSQTVKSFIETRAGGLRGTVSSMGYSKVNVTVSVKARR